MAPTLSKDLPYDIMKDILLRLPVKTLIRFRCVCKLWYYTISNPSFISTHFNRVCSYDNNNGYLQFLNVRQDWCLLNEQTYTHHLELPIPFKCESGFKFVDTINGLACLSDKNNNIYLWNPSIRKSKALAFSLSTFPPSLFSNVKNYVAIGFGFHSQTNDYRIVRILYCRDVDGQCFENQPPLVEVYSLSTDSWRRIEADVPSSIPLLPYVDSNVFINGSVHCLAVKPVIDEFNDVIMAFDVCDEVFRVMTLPNYYVEGFDVWVLSLHVLKESLSLCAYFADSQRCCIWVMREYGVVESWTKQFSVFVPHVNLSFRSFGFTKTNKVLLLTMDRSLGFYDLESSDLEAVGNPVDLPASKVFPVMETLVLL